MGYLTLGLGILFSLTFGCKIPYGTNFISRVENDQGNHNLTFH
jgi:hypothetical protein